VLLPQSAKPLKGFALHCCFQNSQSRPGPTLSGCDRIIYAIFNYFNNKWTRNTEKINEIKNITDEAA